MQQRLYLKVCQDISTKQHDTQIRKTDICASMSTCVLLLYKLTEIPREEEFTPLQIIER